MADTDTPQATPSVAPPPQDNNIASGLSGEMAQPTAPTPNNAPAPANESTPAPAQSDPTTAPTIHPTDFNSFQDSVKQQETRRNALAEAVNASNVNTDPQKQAKALELGKQFGLPAAAISEDLPEFQRRADLLKNNEIIKSNPKLLNWAINNPEMAAAAKDDYQNLNMLGRTVDQLASVTTGVGQTMLKVAGASLSLNKYLPIGALEDKVINFASGEDDVLGQAGSYVQQVAAKNAPNHLLGQLTGGAAYALAGPAAPFVAGASEGSYTTQQLRDQGVDSTTADIGGVGAGALNTAAFMVPMGKFAVGEGTKAFVKSAIGSTLKSGAVGAGQSVLNDFGLNQLLKSEGYGKAAEQYAPSWDSAISGAETMAGFHLAGEAYHATKDVKAMNNDIATLNDVGTKAYKEFRNNDYDHDKAIVAARAVQGSVSGEQQSLYTLNKLIDGAADSKTRTRSPDSFKSFMDSQIPEGSPMEKVYVPADKVAEIYNQKGITPGEDDEILGKAVPDIAKQLQEGVERGGDIAINTSDYLTHIADTETDKTLRPDIRLGEEGRSENEVKELMQNLPDLMKQFGVTSQMELERQVSENKSQQDVYDDLHDKYRTHFPEDQAKQYALLHTTMLNNLAEMQGRNVSDMHKETPFTIKRTGNKTVSGIDYIKTLEGKTRAQVEEEAGNAAPYIDRAAQMKQELLAEARNKTDKVDVSNPASVRKILGLSQTPDTFSDWIKRQGGISAGIKKFERKWMGLSKKGRSISEYAPGEVLKALDGRPDLVKSLIKMDGVPLDELARKAEADGWLVDKPGAYQQSYSDIEKEGQPEDVIELLAKDAAGEKVYHPEVQEQLDRLEVNENQSVGTHLGVNEHSSIADIAKAMKDNDEAGHEAGGEEYSQKGEDNKGSMSITRGQYIMNLFAKSDLSTPLHEMGHMFLDQMTKAIDGGASDARLQSIYGDLKKWWNGNAEGLAKEADVSVDEVKDYLNHKVIGGIESDSQKQIYTAMHEQFARSFEAYLMEGKAPAPELVGAFAKFKSWLTNIYKKVQALGAPIDDKIRSVFDRMLASDEQIEAAQRLVGLNNMVADPAALGMTQEEGRLYSQALEKQTAIETARLLRKAMADIRRQKTEWWKKGVQAEADNVRNDLLGRKDLQAFNYLMTGKDLAGQEMGEVAKLSKDDLVAMMNGDTQALKTLPAGSYQAKDGWSPEELAQVFGYEPGQGKDMIRDLQTLQAQKKEIGKSGTAAFISHLVDSEAERRMVEKHGDVLKDGTIEKEAMDAVHGAGRAKLLDRELESLIKKVGGDPRTQKLTLEHMKEIVKTNLGDMPVKEAANDAAFQRAESKWSKEVQRALQKDDSIKAVDGKLKQLMNHLSFKESREIGDMYDKGQSFFKRLAAKKSIKSIDQEYLNQVHGLLSDLGFKIRRDPKELSNALTGNSLSDFFDSVREDGGDMFVSDWLMDKNKPAYKDLTSDQFRDLKNSIESIIHNGRDAQKIIDNNKAVDFQAIKDEAVAQRRPGEVIKFPQKRRTVVGKTLDAIKDSPNSVGSALIRTEEWVQALDNDKPMGVYFRTLFKPLADSLDHENIMKAQEKEAWDKMKDLVDDKWHKRQKELVTTPELIDSRTGQPRVFVRSELNGIAANFGNASNLDKMLRGENWKRDDVKAVLDREMTKMDWDVTQAMIDRLEHYWPSTVELYKKLTGIAPTKIEATPIETPHGTYKGGYWPVMYDASRSAEVKAKEGFAAPLDGKVGENMSFLNGMTSNSRTITRTKAAYPMLYDTDIIPSKLYQAIHDLAFRESIMNANKFLRSPTIINEIRSRLSPEAYDQMKGWVKDIAGNTKDDKNIEGLTKLMKTVRQNVTATQVLYRLSTVVKHGSTAFFHSMAEVGPANLVKAISEYGSNPRAVRDRVYEASPFMRYRSNQIDVNIRQAQANLNGGSALVENMKKYGHYPISALDQASAIPTWLAAQAKATKDGFSVEEANTLADQAVRNAHGAASPVDTSSLFRSHEFAKTFLVWGNFMNHTLNRGIYRTAREVKYGQEALRSGDTDEALSHFGNAAQRTFWTFVVPGILINQLLDGGKKKGESIAHNVGESIFNEFAGTLPGGSDVAHAAEGEQSFENHTPVGRLVYGAAGAMKDIGKEIKGEQPSKKMVSNLGDTVGAATGLPVGGQVSQSAQFLWDAGHGVQNPHGVGEWLRGLVFGHAKPKESK